MELKSKTSPFKIMSIVLVLLILGSGGGIGIAFLTQQAKTVVPHMVTSSVKFTVYVPTDLPGNFAISTDTFAAQENDSLVVFTAKDSTDSVIGFTEQAKPTNFNFDNFYASQMQDAAVLSGVPYPSTWGKSRDGTRRMLSIVTDKTWVLVSTLAPIDEDGMKQIAKSLRAQ